MVSQGEEGAGRGRGRGRRARGAGGGGDKLYVVKRLVGFKPGTFGW